MYLLGYDIGSSSVKASLVNAESGKCVSSAFFPKTEAEIIAVKPGWAEQNPENWWENLKLATQAVLADARVDAADIKAIGISYQMHGLVCVDKDQKVLRPAIIWCDSRAVPYGQKAFETLGEELCLSHLLNSPGNFTASKLAWIKENEPAVYEKIYKIMLPGDYIAMKLSGTICTTVSGLSEGMFWDFKNNRVADFLMKYYGFDSSLIADIRPTFSEQGRVNAAAAQELGLKEGTPVTYRAGDQPNNALSLNVFNPGEIASTAGTSGVVYGVNGEVNYDPKSRVNTFAHVNHTAEQTRLGVLLCINGTGILNSWVKRTVAPEGISYSDMNVLAAQAPIGSAGISILPFGNGANVCWRTGKRAVPFKESTSTSTASNILSVRHRKVSYSLQVWYRHYGADGYSRTENPCGQSQYVPQSAVPRNAGRRNGCRYRTVRHRRFCRCSQRCRYRCGHL